MVTSPATSTTVIGRGPSTACRRSASTFAGTRPTSGPSSVTTSASTGSPTAELAAVPDARRPGPATQGVRQHRAGHPAQRQQRVDRARQLTRLAGAVEQVPGLGEQQHRVGGRRRRAPGAGGPPRRPAPSAADADLLPQVGDLGVDPFLLLPRGDQLLLGALELLGLASATARSAAAHCRSCQVCASARCSRTRAVSSASRRSWAAYVSLVTGSFIASARTG